MMTKSSFNFEEWINIINCKDWKDILKDDPCKFDDRKKNNFFSNLLKTGQLELSCSLAGVDDAAFRREMNNNEDFRQTVEHVIKLRKQSIIASLESQFIGGEKDEIFDDDGNIIGYKIRYETPARIKVIQRYDCNYTDTSSINLSSDKNFGVMVVPQILEKEDWKKQAENVRKENGKNKE